MRVHWTRLRSDERGAALLETALALPLLLVVSVSIFEFGRAYQTMQVVTNAAREGARVAVLPGITDAMVTARVQSYLTAGQLSKNVTPTVSINRNTPISYGAGSAPGATVTVNYPFKFMVLNNVLKLVAKNPTAGNDFNMASSATMRTE
jgi:Flp pilus assembly protein TadG